MSIVKAVRLEVRKKRKGRGGKRRRRGENRRETERQSPQCLCGALILCDLPLILSSPGSDQTLNEFGSAGQFPPEQTADGLKRKHLEQGKTVLSFSLFWQSVFFFFCLVLFPFSPQVTVICFSFSFVFLLFPTSLIYPMFAIFSPSSFSATFLFLIPSPAFHLTFFF